MFFTLTFIDIDTYSHYNLKILRSKVTKNIKNLRKKFCEFDPWFAKQEQKNKE